MSANFQNFASGIGLGSLAADPSPALNGDFYYSTSLNAFRAYQNGTWQNMIGGSGPITSPLELNQITTPSPPPSGFDNLYFKNDDNLYIQNAAGVETPILQSGSAAFATYVSSQVVSGSSISGSVGSFQTFSTSPAFTVTPTITGTYKVYAALPLVPGPGNNVPFAGRIFNTSGGATLIAESQVLAIGFESGVTDPGFSGTAQSLYTLIAGNTYVFDIQGKVENSGTITLTPTPFYMFCEGVGLNGTLNTGGTSFALFTSNQVNTLSTIVNNSSFETFDNSPAFTFTPVISGIYKIYGSLPLNMVGADEAGNGRIFNTSGGATLLSESTVVTWTTGTEIITSGLAQSVYQLTAGTPYVFDVQGNNAGGTGVYLDGRPGVGASFYLYAEGVGLSNTSQNFPVNMKVTGSGSWGGSAPIALGTVLYDSNSGYNTSTGVYTVPYAGYYLVGWNGNGTSGTKQVQIYVNGSNPDGQIIDNGGSNLNAEGLITTLKLNANDQITWIAPSSFSTNVTSQWVSSVSLANALIGPDGRTTGSAFAFYASSIIATASSGVTSFPGWTTFDNSPAFTFTPTISGIYKVYSSASIYQVGTNNEANVRVFNTSGGGTLLQESPGEIYGTIAGIISSVYAQSTYSLTAGTTYVFDLQGRTTGGTMFLNDGALTSGNNAGFYMFAEGVGLNGQFQAPVTPWDTLLSFTPSSSFGTTINNSYQTRVVGDTLEVKGYFTTGTVTGAAASLALPTGYVIDASKLNFNGSTLNGNGVPLTSSSAPISTIDSQVYPFYDGSDNANIYFANATGTTAFTKAVVSNFLSNNEKFVFEFSVPIVGLYGGQLDGVSSIVRSLTTGNFPFSNSLLQVLDSGGINPIKVTLTTNGGDVLIGLGADGTTNPGCVFIDSVTDDAGYIYFYRDGVQISVQQMSMQTNLTYNLLSIPSSSFSYIDSPSAGTHTYTVYVAGGSTNRGNQAINNTILFAKPLSALGGGGSGGSAFGTETPYSPNVLVTTLIPPPDIGNPVYFAAADQPSLTLNSDAVYASSGSVTDPTASGNTGDAIVKSGANAGSGNSGNVILTPGAVNTGTRGSIRSQDGSEGNPNYTWVSKDTVGSGNWTALTTYPAASIQTLTAGFTIAFAGTNTYLPITAASAVTSDPTTIIAAGTAIGQSVIIENQGSNTIILKAGGNVKVPQGIDFSLSQYGIIELVWNGTVWNTMNTSANG